MSERNYDPKTSEPKPKKDYYETERRSPYDKPFTKAWDDLIKFGDCPICHGDPMACPTPDVPASSCPTRRNAIKHMRRGKGAPPERVLRY
jgi:hypothetical protein